MKQLILKATLSCMIVFGSFQSASATDVFCLGNFENTMYASVAGLARYQIICDNGKEDSVQKAWTYSSAAHDRLFESKAVPAAAQLGVVRIEKRGSNNLGVYDVFRTKGKGKPERIAKLSRSVYKRRGVITEVIQLSDNGKETRFPEATISSMSDLSNVDKIAAQEGMNRSRGITPQLDSGYQIFILYR